MLWQFSRFRRSGGWIKNGPASSRNRTAAGSRCREARGPGMAAVGRELGSRGQEKLSHLAGSLPRQRWPALSIRGDDGVFSFLRRRAPRMALARPVAPQRPALGSNRPAKRSKRHASSAHNKTGRGGYRRAFLGPRPPRSRAALAAVRPSFGPPAAHFSYATYGSRRHCLWASLRRGQLHQASRSQQANSPAYRGKLAARGCRTAGASGQSPQRYWDRHQRRELLAMAILTGCMEAICPRCDDQGCDS
jgi:hypothetical protein